MSPGFEGRWPQGRPSLTNILEIVAVFWQRDVHRLSLLDGARNRAVPGLPRSPTGLEPGRPGRSPETSPPDATASGRARDRLISFDTAPSRRPPCEPPRHASLSRPGP